MVICFDASHEAKRALDALLDSKQFHDISEIISVALINYQILQRSVSEGRSSCEIVAQPGSAIDNLPSVPGIGTKVVPNGARVPAIFRVEASTYEGIVTLNKNRLESQYSLDAPPAQWLFGQLNRFLPVKATCRALVNIFHEKPGGILITDAASTISLAASELGDYLNGLDVQFSLGRQDGFAAAFPSTAPHGPESRLRFESQFVGTLRQGRLTGLPAGINFVQHDTSKDPKLFLTDAGLEFASLPNPVLDMPSGPRPQRLSDSEIRFLLDHINAHVPVELSAYVAVFDAIKSGAKTPEKLDSYLVKKFLLKVVEKAQAPNEITKTFLTTQRTGAVSRMADLNLIGRAKSGLRVTYHITESGEEFRSRVKLP